MAMTRLIRPVEKAGGRVLAIRSIDAALRTDSSIGSVSSRPTKDYCGRPGFDKRPAQAWSGEGIGREADPCGKCCS